MIVDRSLGRSDRSLQDSATPPQVAQQRLRCGQASNTNAVAVRPPLHTESIQPNLKLSSASQVQPAQPASEQPLFTSSAVQPSLRSRQARAPSAQFSLPLEQFAAEPALLLALRYSPSPSPCGLGWAGLGLGPPTPWVSVVPGTGIRLHDAPPLPHPSAAMDSGGCSTTTTITTTTTTTTTTICTE